MNEQRVRQTVSSLALRICDPDRIVAWEATKELVIHQGVPINLFQCDTLATGWPGIAMFFGELAQRDPDCGWDDVAHRYITEMVDGIKAEGLSTGSLYSGSAGMLLASVCCSNHFSEYEGLIRTLTEHVIVEINGLCRSMESDLRITDYDTIEGISGRLSALITAREHPGIDRAIRQGLESLVKRGMIDGAPSAEGYLIAGENHFSQTEAEAFPEGSINTGMAHGLAGVLSLLSRAMLIGFDVEGQKDLIARIVTFYWDTLGFILGSYVWPSQISRQDYEARDIRIVAEERDAWCYGMPGISYALSAAGAAMGDYRTIDRAVELMTVALERRRGIFSPILCHGMGGLLVLACEQDRLLGTSYHQAAIDSLVEDILWCASDERRYVFQNAEVTAEGTVCMDNAGFLEGASGVGLALLHSIRPSCTPWVCAMNLGI